tara:strand:+ start:259 stop:726 length:468 start_codon:yes stop_codon:yes gene_type:complete
MAEVTAAIITSSTAVFLAAIPCMMKIHQKTKIHKELGAIYIKTINGLDPSESTAFSILADVTQYFKQLDFRQDQLCFSEFVSGKPQNIHTSILIDYVSKRIDEFLLYASKSICRRRNTKLVCHCYELLLQTIVYYIQHETNENDFVYNSPSRATT